MNNSHDFTPNMDLISREPLVESFNNWIKVIEDRQDDNTWWAERDAVESCLAEVENAPAIVVPHWVKFSERRPPKKNKEYLVAQSRWTESCILQLAWYAPVDGFEYETDVTAKRDYNANWAFARYNEDLDLIGMPDKWIDYWLEGLELPKGENDDS